MKYVCIWKIASASTIGVAMITITKTASMHRGIGFGNKDRPYYFRVGNSQTPNDEEVQHSWYEWTGKSQLELFDRNYVAIC
jgi:hypothetical protein